MKIFIKKERPPVPEVGGVEDVDLLLVGGPHHRGHYVGQQVEGQALQHPLQGGRHFRFIIPDFFFIFKRNISPAFEGANLDY